MIVMIPDVDVVVAHQALADAGRLEIAQALLTRDLAPGEIAQRWGMSTALVAHHVRTLAEAGLVVRRTGEHDRRRSYVALRHEVPEVVALIRIGAEGVAAPTRVAFVCTRNSARSKLAAALWREVSPVPVVDAGTEPAAAPHPLTVRAAARRGLRVDPTMREVAGTVTGDDLVIAVCDHVHETLPPRLQRWHWSIPDPVPAASAASFEAACDAIQSRVQDLQRALSQLQASTKRGSTS